MATISRNSPTFTLLTVGVILLSLSLVACAHSGDGVWIPMPKDTSALGKINHFIPKGDIEKFRAQYGPARDSMARHMPSLYMPMSEAFNKPMLIDLLKDSNCVGIRIYYGLKAGGKSGQLRLMLVGVDSQGHDLYYQKGSGAAAQADNMGFGGGEYGQCNPPCDSIP
jgi:hypothetical protein